MRLSGDRPHEADELSCNCCADHPAGCPFHPTPGLGTLARLTPTCRGTALESLIDSGVGDITRGLTKLRLLATVRSTGRYGTFAITGSIRLDARELDDLAPFLSFVGDELGEVGGRTRKHRAAQVD